MKTIVVTDRAAGTGGMTLVERPDAARLAREAGANYGVHATFDDAVAAFNPTDRVKGKTIIRVRP